MNHTTIYQSDTRSYTNTLLPVQLPGFYCFPRSQSLLPVQLPRFYCFPRSHFLFLPVPRVSPLTCCINAGPGRRGSGASDLRSFSSSHHSHAPGPGSGCWWRSAAPGGTTSKLLLVRKLCISYTAEPRHRRNDAKSRCRLPTSPSPFGGSPTSLDAPSFFYMPRRLLHYMPSLFDSFSVALFVRFFELFCERFSSAFSSALSSIHVTLF